MDYKVPPQTCESDDSLLDFLRGSWDWQSTGLCLVDHSAAPHSINLSTVLRLMLLMYDCPVSSSSNRIIKFADDTTAVGIISNNDETSYREEVDLIAAWWEQQLFCIF